MLGDLFVQDEPVQDVPVLDSKTKSSCDFRSGGGFGLKPVAEPKPCDVGGWGDTDTVAPPPPPRPLSGLCGILNQGSTCYLNCLLQILVMTPDFRDALFQLGRVDLGLPDDGESTDTKARVIPIQLQRLFARLLLLNAQFTCTTELTSSFGWKENEALQQHDVQELNRILFTAIEDSLIATRGQHIIRQLYRGTIVNQITCKVCGRVVSREEDFLDVCVALGGASSLEDALSELFTKKELLDGPNCYFCDVCDCLVEAEKGGKLRRLPQILTVSLLRFSYDFDKQQRYKETKKLSFPTELSLKSYCEDQTAGDGFDYELFATVIHRGSSHSGHYHAYIRDVENMAHWTYPDEEKLLLPKNHATETLDLMECRSPVDVLRHILQKEGATGMPVHQLSAELTKQLGVSWKKRYKTKHGTITKFLTSHDEHFYLDPTTNWVCVLAATDSKQEVIGSACKSNKNHICGTEDCNGGRESTVHRPGHGWFDFDDTHIHPIQVTDLQTQFSGKESAYMLFYERKRPQRTNRSDRTRGVPEWLIDEVQVANDQLQCERFAYDEQVNAITVSVHFSLFYSVVEGALVAHGDSCHFMELSIDRRKTIGQLKIAIMELGGEIVMENFVLHTAESHAAGLHLYTQISADNETAIADVGLSTGSRIFVWDGHQVGGHPVNVGNHCAPVQLNIVWSLDDDNERSETRVFPKDTIVSEVKSSLLSADLEKGHLSIWLQSLEGAWGEEPTKRLLTNENDELTLAQLDITDGQTLVVKPASENGWGKEVEEKEEQEYTWGETPTEYVAEWPQSADNSANDTMKLTLECSIAGGISVQLDVTPETTVSQCLAMKSLIGVEGEDWHLRKVDWCGDPADLLDDLDASLDSCHLANGDRVLLERGKLTPKGFLKITLWQFPVPPATVLPECETDPSVSFVNRRLVGELVISAQESLESLKREVLLLTQSVAPDWPLDRLRVRTMHGDRPARVLRMNTQSLKGLKLAQDCDVAIQFLDHAEALDANSILLNVCVRAAQSRRYLAPNELVWCTSHGADVASLRHTVAENLAMLPDHVGLAKRLPDKHDWMVIGEGKSKKTQGKRKCKRHGNVKQAPYYIQDGDEIGVKDLRFHWSNDDDFGTEEDDIAKGVHQTAALTSANVSCSRPSSSDFGNESSTFCKREERPIKIHVANFG